MPLEVLEKKEEKTQLSLMGAGSSLFNGIKKGTSKMGTELSANLQDINEMTKDVQDLTKPLADKANILADAIKTDANTVIFGEIEKKEEDKLMEEDYEDDLLRQE